MPRCPHTGFWPRPPPQMVASPWPLCERLFPPSQVAALGNCWVSICTTMRVRRCRCGTMDGCMRSAGVPARRRPRGGDDSTGFASTPPGHRLPVPAIRGVHRPAGDVGPALAGAWRACPVARRARRADRHPEMVRQVGAGGAGDRQRNRHVDAGDGQDRAGYRCGRRRGLPARAGPAAQRDRSGSGHQHPPGPRRRSRRTGAHVRIRVADRGAGVLPRPVAQGASPQAQAAAIETSSP